MSAVREVIVPGLGSRYFPADTPDEQVIASINNELHTYNESDISPAQRTLIGVGRGLISFNEGAQQIGAQALSPIIGDQNYKNITSQGMARKEEYDKTQNAGTFSGKAGEFVGGALPYAIAPFGALNETLGAKIGSTVAGNVLGDAAAGAVMGGASFVPDGGSRLNQAALGATISPAIGAVGRAVATPLVKAWNAKQGNYAPGVNTQAISDFEQAGVPYAASDVSKNPVLQAAERYASTMPSGLQGWRLDQENAMKKQVQDFSGALEDVVKKNPYGGKTGWGKIQQEAQNLDQARSAKARQIMDFVETHPDPALPDVMGTSVDTQLIRNQFISDKKYNKFYQLADAAGPIMPSKLMKSLGEASSEIQSNPNKFSSDEVKIINHFQDRAKQFLPQSGYAGETLPGAGTASNLADFEKELSKYISPYYKGQNSLVGESGVGILQKLKNATTSDLSSFGENAGGDISRAYSDAKSFYKTNVAPYKDKQLAISATSRNPDALYKTFITRGQNDGAQNIFYNAMDEKGRAAVRAQIIQRALVNAFDEQTGTFSNKKFANEIDALSGSVKTMFRGQDAEAIRGITNMAKHIQSSFVPKTGAMNVPLVASGALSSLAGAVFGGPAGAAVGAAIPTVVSQLARIALTSNVGKKYLLASGKLKVGSPGMQMVVDKLANLAQTGATKASMDRANK